MKSDEGTVDTNKYTGTVLLIGTWEEMKPWFDSVESELEFIWVPAEELPNLSNLQQQHEALHIVFCPNIELSDQIAASLTLDDQFWKWGHGKIAFLWHDEMVSRAREFYAYVRVNVDRLYCVWRTEGMKIDNKESFIGWMSYHFFDA